MAQEHDCLAKRLADQEKSHKAALKAVQDSEAALQAEYETEAASWAEAKQTLINGYGCWESEQNFKIFYASPRSIYGVY